MMQVYFSNRTERSQLSLHVQGFLNDRVADGSRERFGNN